MKRRVLTALLLLSVFGLTAQNSFTIERTLNWVPGSQEVFLFGEETMQVISFENALFNTETPSLPQFAERFPIGGPGQVNITITPIETEAIAPGDLPTHIDKFSGSPQAAAPITQDGDQFYTNISFIPILKTPDGTYSKISSFTLTLEWVPQQVTYRDPDDVQESALANGQLFKMAVTQTGMYKLTYSYLKDELGLDVDNIDPRKIQILGIGGGILPESNAAFRYPDIEENGIWIEGQSDGVFNAGDYILFFAEGPDKWELNTDLGRFFMQKNIYDTRNYYFLKVGTQNGLRLSTKPTTSQPANYTSNAYDDYARLEEDKENLLYSFSSTQGSGKRWYGDNFRLVRERTYTEPFIFPGRLANEPIQLDMSFVSRSNVSAQVAIDCNGNTFSTFISGVNISNSLGIYGRTGNISQSFTASGDDLVMTLTYPETSGISEGWLDYIQVNVRRNLQVIGDQFSFRDLQAIGQNTIEYQIANGNETWAIWDITDPLKPQAINASVQGANLTFKDLGDTLRQYTVFQASSGLLTPAAIGPVENQNLHGITNADLVIIYPQAFEGAVQRLANHRAEFNDLSVAMVRVDLIFNEFSAGRQDPSAIRDFARMLDKRDPDFNYLLLFGDGSFDFRNILGLDENQRHNFIPVFETLNSLDPIRSFPTDDYFGLLSDSEGSNLIGALDIALGRLTVKSASEANQVVDKMIRYDTDPELKRDWRNKIVMVADDEDSNTHFGGAERISKSVEAAHPELNIDKLYLDAFQQVSTSGGTRYPDVSDAINQNIFKGALVVNYLGHGGSTGWAQERILLSNDIVNWRNGDKTPLLVTATCSFTGYDEPNYETAGELSLLNNQGGVIGLFTTTRAVYAHSNERLTQAAFDFLFDKIDGQKPAVGEILRRAKNSNAADTLDVNARKFVLIGDPTLQIGISEYDVVTTKINGVDVTAGNLDTLKALSKVTIEGYVADANGGVQSSFNGIVYPTVYDKRDTLKTLGQDPTSFAASFTLQKNIVFKGAATVTNGVFSFSFVVPKDIDYNFGFGKISYYAQNGEVDATGYFDEVMIGGTSSNFLADDTGPLVEVFMNNEDFAIGGLTDEDPILFVKLSDDNGINVVGSSIGHDLTGTLDQNQANTLLLNDFYEAEVDDYTKGVVRYPLYDLEEGRHHISVKAWDVANNSGVGETEFIVADNANVALERVLNYPNPFTTCTWFEFDPNQPVGQLLDVQVQIYTVSGKLVKTLERQIQLQGDRVSRLDGLKWDGTDDFGDTLARGVYLYKVKVRTPNGVGSYKSAESEFEKIVLLR